MQKVLDKCLTPTTEMITNLIEIENAHINPEHPDFVGGADSLLGLFERDDDKPSNKPVQGQPRNYPLVDKSKKPAMDNQFSVIDEEDKEEEESKEGN